MKVFGIFEGGGAKGLAHVGAIRACEEKGIEFCGVAGASAGAIAASLIAAGYHSSELFDPEDLKNNDSIFTIDPTKLLGSEISWERLQACHAAAKKLPSSRFPMIAGTIFKLRHGAVVKSITEKLGVFDTDKFEAYLNAKLAEKLIVKVADTGAAEKVVPCCKSVLFKDISLPLKIVATDIERRRLQVFSKETTPDVPVARAVAASISLPFVFRPKELTIAQGDENGQSEIKVKAVDGGLLSNFPAWLFDAERGAAGRNVPTLGFRLIPTKKDESTASWGPFAKHVAGVAGTVIDGDPLLETREIDNLHEIPLRVSFGTLDFKLSDADKVKLFREGYDAALEAFYGPGFPVDEIEARGYLESIVEAFRQVFEVDDSVLIRANIATRTTRNTLRINYSCYMDSPLDTDDQLEFALGSGACGRCWTNREPVICDLKAAKADFESAWRMNKYQQALVRQDLTALICYPIVDPETQLILGVLNLDSPDESMLNLFSGEEVETILASAAAFVARMLAPNREVE